MCDLLGRRATKVILGTNFLYDFANAVQELSGTTPTANLLTGGVVEYFTRTDTAGTRNFITDAIGSTLGLADSTGAIQAQYTYDAFGNTTALGTSANSFQFTGRESDGSGLYFNRARYYSPTTGRFISEDPIGFTGGGPNLYSYTGNDPINFTDSLGLDYTTYQSVMGLLVYVNASITIYGPGASPELAAQWQHWITNAWNKNPGFRKCKVSFNVRVTADPKATNWRNASPDSDFPGANNFIYVPQGMPGNPFINPGNSTGTIPSDTLSFSVAHEFGHLLDLWDSNIGGWHINPWRPDNDIMNEGDVISQYDINRIIGGAGGVHCGCK